MEKLKEIRSQVSILLQSKYIKHVIVNSKFQFDVESFNLKFHFKFGVSNESTYTNFRMNLQNSEFMGISVSLMTNGARKGHWHLIPKSWSDRNFKKSD